ASRARQRNCRSLTIFAMCTRLPNGNCFLSHSFGPMGERVKARSPEKSVAIFSHVKPNQSETSELLDKLAKSTSWWRRFFESSAAEEIHQIISKLSPLDLASLDQRW